MFKIYKDALKRLSYKRHLHWHTVHRMSLQAVTPHTAKQFFKKCGVPGIEQWLSEQLVFEEDNPLSVLFNTLFGDM